MTRRHIAWLIGIIVIGLVLATRNAPLRHAAPPGFMLLPSTLPAQPRPVVVAVVDLPRGASVTPEAVKIKEFPRDLVPAGALSKLEDAVNRVIFVPLTKDEPVLESKLAPKGAGRGLSALIPRGMRAYSVKVPDVAQGFAGFILPGNRVDVLLSLGEISGTHETGGGSTITLLQNVEILAVDQKMDSPSDNKVDTKDLRSVTLLVTPQQANLLDLGQNKGMLHLALRNRQDNEAAQTKPATPNDRWPPPLPKAPEPHPTGWHIRRLIREVRVLLPPAQPNRIAGAAGGSEEK